LPARTVLQQADITRALTRISHEILESNRGPDNLVILGIPTRGVVLADRIGALLHDISGTPAALASGGIDGKTVVLVDDVLYSGRTIRAALDALGSIGRPSIVRLATLIDRGHRELPIRPDFVGKNLPSSQSERINVHLAEIDGDEFVTIEEAGQ
jgi:pyrimidine operon attenuation protein/uracil phosphoribosyltransferase